MTEIIEYGAAVVARGVDFEARVGGLVESAVRCFNRQVSEYPAQRKVVIILERWFHEWRSAAETDPVILELVRARFASRLTGGWMNAKVRLYPKRWYRSIPYLVVRDCDGGLL